MMNKTKFYATCPKTRKEFVSKFRTDAVFRSQAEFHGFSVVGECVIFPEGKVADAHVRQSCPKNKGLTNSTPYDTINLSKERKR